VIASATSCLLAVPRDDALLVHATTMTLLYLSEDGQQFYIHQHMIRVTRDERIKLPHSDQCRATSLCFM
jgi:hypothetical protein